MSGPFHPTAHVYDVFYSFIPYEEHAAAVEAQIRTRNPEATTLLDVACGTGHHLEILVPDYERVVGADLDDAMLAVARRRLPDVDFHQADMRQFDIGEQFDAVTCLFSSIGYVRDQDGLDAAIGSMARHLAPGGVLVVEPWLQPDVFRADHVFAQSSTVGDVAVARVSRSSVPEPGVSRMDMEYLVASSEGIDHFTEVHEMGLFTPAQFAAAFESAGLAFEFVEGGTPIGRGLAVGVLDS